MQGGLACTTVLGTCTVGRMPRLCAGPRTGRWRGRDAEPHARPCLPLSPESFTAAISTTFHTVGPDTHLYTPYKYTLVLKLKEQYELSRPPVDIKLKIKMADEGMSFPLAVLICGVCNRC